VGEVAGLVEGAPVDFAVGLQRLNVDSGTRRRLSPVMFAADDHWSLTVCRLKPEPRGPQAESRLSRGRVPCRGGW
jgi:hypothetical protein